MGGFRGVGEGDLGVLDGGWVLYTRTVGPLKSVRAGFNCSMPKPPIVYSSLLHSLYTLTPFTGLLTHFANSLLGQLKFMNVFTLKTGTRLSQVEKSL